MAIITKADGTKVNRTTIYQGKGKKPKVIDTPIKETNKNKIGINILSKNNAISKITTSTKNAIEKVKELMTNEKKRQEALKQIKQDPLKKIQEALNKQVQVKQLQETIKEEQNKNAQKKRETVKEALKNIPILKILTKTKEKEKEITKKTKEIQEQKTNLQKQANEIVKEESLKQIKDPNRYLYNKIVGETYSSSGANNYRTFQENKIIQDHNKKLENWSKGINTNIKTLNDINKELSKAKTQEEYNKILAFQYEPLKERINNEINNFNRARNKAVKDVEGIGQRLSFVRINKDNELKSSFEKNIEKHNKSIKEEAKRLGISEYEYSNLIKGLQKSENYAKRHEKTKIINPMYWLAKSNVYDSKWRLSNTGNKIVNAELPTFYLNPAFLAKKYYPNKYTEGFYRYSSEIPYKYVTGHTPSLATTYGMGKVFGIGMQGINQGLTYLSKWGPKAYKTGKYGIKTGELALGGYIGFETGKDIYLTPKEERGRRITETLIDFAAFGTGAKKGFEENKERIPTNAKSKYKKEIEITNPDESLRNIEKIKEISRKALDPTTEKFTFTQKDSLTGREWKGTLTIDQKGNARIKQKSGNIIEEIKVNKKGKGIIRYKLPITYSI